MEEINRYRELEQLVVADVKNSNHIVDIRKVSRFHPTQY